MPEDPGPPIGGDPEVGESATEGDSTGAPGATFEWRRRALQAEEDLAKARADMARAHAEAQTLQQSISEAKKHARLQLLLHQAGVLDMAGAARLAGQALGDKPIEQAGAVISELRRTSPGLFMRSPAASGAPAGARADPLDRARQDALTSNDRRALLRYLRARRAA